MRLPWGGGRYDLTLGGGKSARDFSITDSTTKKNIEPGDIAETVYVKHSELKTGLTKTILTTYLSIKEQWEKVKSVDIYGIEVYHYDTHHIEALGRVDLFKFFVTDGGKIDKSAQHFYRVSGDPVHERIVMDVIDLTNGGEITKRYQIEIPKFGRIFRKWGKPEVFEVETWWDRKQMLNLGYPADEYTAKKIIRTVNDVFMKPFKKYIPIK